MNRSVPIFRMRGDWVILLKRCVSLFVANGFQVIPLRPYSVPATVLLVSKVKCWVRVK